ncbi:hypothetical protein, partial [uncultured Nostoc sp.]|uniref:hypothetical protein n=1 Tax=uncultured Nostoc sp. TaxID=340711 RepID=UPI0035CB089C
NERVFASVLGHFFIWKSLRQFLQIATLEDVLFFLSAFERSLTFAIRRVMDREGYTRLLAKVKN